MLTRCPHCQTHFRVTAAQLKPAQGRVRCGVCQQSFDALESLSDEVAPGWPARASSESRRWQDGMASTPAATTTRPERALSPEPAAATAAADNPGAPAATAGPADETARERAPEIPPQTLPETPLETPPAIPSEPPQEAVPAVPAAPALDLERAPAAPPVARETQEVVGEAAPAADPDTAASAASADSAGLASSADGEAEAPATTPPPAAAPPEPTAHAPVLSVPAKAPAARWPWWVGSVVLFFSALAQLAYLYRVELTLVMPELKPALSAACAALGCTLPRPMKPELLEIVSSELSPEGGRLLLTATVKNRAPFAQDYPHLELTLTDARDQAVVRKAFAPAEWLPPGHDAAQGFPARGEVAVQLMLASEADAAVGYRLYLFYP